MNAKQYQTEAMKTDFKTDASPLVTRLSNPRLARLTHGAFGLTTEVGEINDILKKALIAGKPIDGNHMLEELGDICWYMALILDELGSSFEDVMGKNIAKLRTRYPQGFSETAALAKVDKHDQS